MMAMPTLLAKGCAQTTAPFLIMVFLLLVYRYGLTSTVFLEVLHEKMRKRNNAKYDRMKEIYGGKLQCCSGYLIMFQTSILLIKLCGFYYNN